MIRRRMDISTSVRVKMTRKRWRKKKSLLENGRGYKREKESGLSREPPQQVVIVLRKDTA